MANVKKAKASVSAENNASESHIDKSDVILYSGTINYSGYDEIIKICSGTTRDNVTLILNTLGGDANSAYRIAKFLQTKYKKFTLFIACYCKSAGTLIAVGAHELIFYQSGELGPLDVQLRKDHELGEEYTSGLDMINALDYLNQKILETFLKFTFEFKFGGELSTEVASSMATALATPLYQSLYEQIDPVTLGDITRSMNVASAYGLRLAKNGKNLKANALTKLVSGYPSHGFIIDFDEAGELFEHIRRCTPEESGLAAVVVKTHLKNVGQAAPIVKHLNAPPKQQKTNPDENSSDAGSTGQVDAASHDGDSHAKPQQSSTIGGDGGSGEGATGGDQGQSPTAK